MYRAYHAIRGLTGPDGRSTNAVYGFVTMLRKLINDHQPTYIGASFDLAKPTFRSQLAADYKATRSAMPADLAEQTEWVREACEAMGVPVYTSEGFEADDVIATLARRAAASTASRWLSSPATRISSSWSATAFASTTRATKGAWFDEAGREGQVRRDAGAGDRRARADGRHGRQRQGRAGHRREGREGFDLRLRLARRACSPGQTRCRRRNIAKVSGRTPTTRGRAASWSGCAPTSRFRSSPSRFQLSRRIAREVLRAVLAARIPHAGHRVRADCRVDRQGLRDSHHARRARRARAGAARRPDGLPSASSPTDRRVCARLSSGSCFRLRPRQARYVPLGHEGFGGGNTLDRRNGDRSARAGARGSGDSQGRPRSQSRHGRARRVTASRSPVSMLDTMLASYLIDATKSSEALEPTVLEQLGIQGADAGGESAAKATKALSLRAGPGRRAARLRR